MDEVCRVFNLDKDVVERYIQFGGVFNLLHAAASYLRIHQRGFGAVGVSSKYGRRSKLRYPIFWNLPKIGSLPNPDPADTAEIDTPKQISEGAVIDSVMEANRRELRCRAQEWAGLTVDPEVSVSLSLIQPLYLLYATVVVPGLCFSHSFPPPACCSQLGDGLCLSYSSHVSGFR